MSPKWQRTLLSWVSLLLIATSFGVGLLIRESLLAWADMAHDAHERMNTPVPPALLLASSLSVEVVLALICFLTGLLAWHSGQWFGTHGRTVTNRRIGTVLAWSVRLVVLLGPLGYTVMRVWAAFLPNANGATALSLPPDIFLGFAVLGFMVLSGPLLVLTWVGLARWVRWMNLVMRPTLPGQIQKTFGGVSTPLLWGGLILLGLGVWQSRIVMINADFSGATLHIQQVFFYHRPWLILAFVLLELLGGVMLMLWRKAGWELSHELDPQYSRIGAHLQGSLPLNKVSP